MPCYPGIEFGKSRVLKLFQFFVELYKARYELQFAKSYLLSLVYNGKP